ncbi:MAG TPA: TRAP transporter small permease [Burkholderiaceae bacterium]|nr:TRAP transporter small permease [Burkholderiaceae bacterium]
MTYTDPVGRALERLAQALAILGGLALTGVALMSLYSVTMRNVAGAPIQGDFELAQFGCAVSVAAFLPFTQLRNGNIFVDFFTQNASARAKSTLDGIGSLAVGLALALIAWRTGVGGLDAWRYDESTMLMGLPIWPAYASMVPSFAIAALAAFYSAWRHWALHEVAESEERS